MNKVYAAGIIILLFLSCKKENEKQEDLYIRGRLFLTDTITQNTINAPLANRSVRLAKNNGDSLNFLYSDSTDADGYFLFNLQNNYQASESFVLRYEERIGGVWYAASDTVMKGEKNVVLNAGLSRVRQNGFYAYLQDSTGGKVPAGKVYIFNSMVFAGIGNTAGAYDSAVANANGLIFKLNLPAGTYYLNAKKQVDTMVFERKLRTVELLAQGINKLVPDTIQLKRTH